MNSKYKFFLWLIDTLSVKSLTLPEIQERWKDSSANDEKSSLNERTFIRYRRDIESLMHIEIKCDKRTNRYSIIHPTNFKNRDFQEWLLSAFRVSNLAKRINQRQEIMIESTPSGSNLIQPILDAIEKQYPVRFTYQSHYHDRPCKVELYPAFIRLFKQRWYVIGEVIDLQDARIFALERIQNLEQVEGVKYKISTKLKDILSPDKYFEHCFGVIRLYDPLFIRFRAFWPQDAYLRDVPIHESQSEIIRTDDYSDFEIYVRPTYDLMQEFLWHRDKLAVLSPESFRLDMIKVLQATIKGYETGENHSVDI